MKHEQLPLFFVQPDPRVAVYDPFWDEQTSNVGEQLISEDSPCQSVGEQVTSTTKKVAHQHDIEDSPCQSVGEQVTSTTKKVAHQHDKPITHWVERYWVKRGGSKLWYYRYTWMSGRKLNRHYIGSVRSPSSNLKKQAVENAILDGQSPNEIIALIRQFTN